MKPLNRMTLLEVIDHLLARAENAEKELQQHFNDLVYCENRWPGQFTAQELQAFSEWKVAEAKVASLRLQRDQEAAK
jgi:hypothetical protein